MKLRLATYKNRVRASDILEFRKEMVEEFARDGMVYSNSLENIKNYLESAEGPFLEMYDEEYREWVRVPEVNVYRGGDDTDE